MRSALMYRGAILCPTSSVDIMPSDSRPRSAGGELVLAKLCWIRIEEEDPDRRGADETKLACGDCFIDPDKDLVKWKQEIRDFGLSATAVMLTCNYEFAGFKSSFKGTK
jgi:hypothetical protein